LQPAMTSTFKDARSSTTQLSTGYMPRSRGYHLVTSVYSLQDAWRLKERGRASEKRHWEHENAHLVKERTQALLASLATAKLDPWQYPPGTRHDLSDDSSDEQAASDDGSADQSDDSHERSGGECLPLIMVSRVSA
jgi:hypothetical protein